MQQELQEALLSDNLELVEDYPSDPRRASCLVLGFTKDARPIHLVCGISHPDMLVLVTSSGRTRTNGLT
ncbi:MAG: DUF4258 domain-containing protein [Chloroflexi bacterium]|nr:DUF4258 domain-containing protein [Chloroflexota bacterium]MCL5950287.1 DUF4258 domain-containing protein [Chloroflexota bacterium]